MLYVIKRTDAEDFLPPEGVVDEGKMPEIVVDALKSEDVIKQQKQFYDEWGDKVRWHDTFMTYVGQMLRVVKVLQKSRQN